jgi:hypothetical protein
MPTYKIVDSVFPTCSLPLTSLASESAAEVGEVFETGVGLIVGVWLVLATTAVFLLVVFAVELFAVVFVVPPQAEKSNAKAAMLNVEKVVVFMTFIFLFEAELSISVDASEEADLSGA